ncbi:aspartyl-tRNA(Asn)/glutamyl-tRNA(Gln) amidotransferase subunit C [Lewinella marina]|uniref:Aspartyl/glutamyl-tRNA(Asn/Gln) amidotransferase subunit C n=1 Tax=Neolewinella marina TaxID=438751 RepID=A0A2G0CFD5_9BACT|nr:Asp-tRNA(Asn)/Glu-tRNA(Gln) amidotransferase subunit GatC [Neolewinella marina]NJB85627.1 aspartyl-tRNA(Asn)/glutamyl-tRNA(Gln) amidotransferase subunit C [Neolewinella marina]PHK98688.1 Asp-tRNA(Asn)/Glu-tRNA(Gln) amidotransferase GatCAB subunit C [Neolewinella marina]
MTVDDDLVLRLADLAKLDVSENRLGKLRGDLTRILAMVEKLNELDLEDVEPLRYVTEAEQALRPDRAGDHLDRERAMENAPESDGVFFRVPRVI